MILPRLDFAGKNTAAKLVNLLPGGEELTTAGNIFLSSAAVVKNAIGQQQYLYYLQLSWFQ